MAWNALAREHLIKHQAEGVDVAALAGLAACKLLGSHVCRRALAGVDAGDAAGERGQPEIGDQHLAASVDHDVAGFEVAVQDAFFVRGVEPGAQAAGDIQGLFRRQASDAAKERGEILSVHILHREKWRAFRFPDIIDAADIGMRDLAGDADFGAEALQRRTAGRMGGQELERYFLAEDDVERAVNFAHSATAESAGNAISLCQNSSGRPAEWINRAGEELLRSVAGAAVIATVPTSEGAGKEAPQMAQNRCVGPVRAAQRGQADIMGVYHASGRDSASEKVSFTLRGG